MHNKMRTWIIIIVFLSAITSIRLFVYYVQKPIEQPHAVAGVLDLRGWTIPEDQMITLDGEWSFYPSSLVKSEEEAAAPKSSAGNQTYLQVPGAWEDAFPEERDRSFHYGSYRLRILLDDRTKGIFKLRTTEIGTASAIYMNGQLTASNGYPSESLELHQARRVPISATFTVDDKIIDILIPVSNHAGPGGITKTIHFGTLDAVNRHVEISVGQQLLLSIVLLMHGLYALMLYLLGPSNNKGLIFFSLIIVCAIASVTTVDERLLFVYVPIPFEYTVKIVLWSYIGVAVFIPLLLRQMFPGHGSIRATRWLVLYCAAYAVYVLLCSSQYTLPTLRYLLGFGFLLMVILSSSLLWSAIRKQQGDAIFLLLSCVSLAINILWITPSKLIYPYQLMQYPYDLIIAVLAFAAFWFKRFFRSVARTEEFAHKLQLANQRKDDFLISTSHELRNPLHGILNIAQSMLERVSEDDLKHKLEIQVAVAKRMTLLINDLMDAALLKENNYRLNVATVKVQSVAEGVVDIIRHIFTDKPVQIRVEIDPNFPAVYADENRLTQILFNLLHNAMKFTDAGTVTVRATQLGGMACVEVRDSGIGMDQETQRRIFLPYEQGETNTAAIYGGFGLGLSICKRLVELHGGELQVSSSPGEGSMFTFTLPLSAAVQSTQIQTETLTVNSLEAEEEAAASMKEVAAASNEKGQLLNKPQILVVDDDGLNLSILNDMLGEDYEITSARSGLEALNCLEKGSFDLIIMDVMMPHMSGYELTRIIRERFSMSDLPILLLTARTRVEDITVGFRSGANDYVAKPVDALELKARVQAWTELRRSIEERLRIEGAWLQAQIQPHFLYNTINSIAALATIDISRMETLLGHFSNYMRMSIDFHNIDQVIPIDREITHIQHYLYIEKERFGHRMEVVWELDPELRFHVPPLSIQTLVENALNHGILRRARGGTVTIRITSGESDYEVSVHDDGVGIREEVMQVLLDPASAVSQGIGLRNTDLRLKQLYHKGLNIRTDLDHGTTVSFEIPK